MNTLNINTGNFALNDNYMFLHDPAMYVDFHDGVGQLPLGYMDKEKTFKQVVQYATFKTGIPETEIRRDIISQEFPFEGALKQLQAETIALLSQRYVDYSDPDWDRVIIGTEVPAPLFPSVVLIGKNVNERELRLYIRRMQITAEDFQVVLGGTDYASIPFRGFAQKDPDPLTTNPTWMFNPAKAQQDNIAFWAFAKAPSGS